jgi:hypothetical protein
MIRSKVLRPHNSKEVETCTPIQQQVYSVVKLINSTGMIFSLYFINAQYVKKSVKQKWRCQGDILLSPPTL